MAKTTSMMFRLNKSQKRAIQKAARNAPGSPEQAPFMLTLILDNIGRRDLIDEDELESLIELGRLEKRLNGKPKSKRVQV